jgi:hypothetical protein
VTAGTATVAGALRRGLADLGVEAVYGLPLAGVDVAEAGDQVVASLLAEAHLLVHRTRCALHHGEGRLTVLDRRAALGAGPGERPAPAPDAVAVDDAAALAGCWVAVAEHLAGPGGTARLAVALDPAAPAGGGPPPPPAAVDRWVVPDRGDSERLDAAEAPVVLVGPGVAEPALVPGLHALAAAGGLGVLNTWGAKGVFDWRSHHHLATVGLQERDLELGGLPAADLVVAAGLDGREVPVSGWGAAPVLALAPGALGPVAEALAGPRRGPAMPALRDGLARVTQEGWAATGVPLAPSAVTRAYARALAGGGLVAADPGTAGYWVARTFATTALGGAVVPARAGAGGLAAACVAVARRARPGRRALAVVDAAGERTAAVVEAAARWGVAVPVERWAGDGPALRAEAHAARLEDLLAAPVAGSGELATDPTQLARMVEVAGEVVAWTAGVTVPPGRSPAAEGPGDQRGHVFR